jgi:predicted Rossmann fold nucleotide-binding protein DprA/Smf involved in DNA uptake
VLEAVGYEPTSVEELIGSCSLSLGEIALALERLASAGHVEEEGGYWRRI